MDDTRELAQHFLEAVAANDAARFEAVLAPEVGLRVMGAEQMEVFQGRARVIQRFQDEWAEWPDARLEGLSHMAEGPRAGVEYRIQGTDAASGRYVEYFRSAFLTMADSQVELIELYCPAPIPSGHRAGWIAPADLSDDEIGRVLEEQPFSFDVRQHLSPGFSGRLSLRHFEGGSGQAHPGSNQVGASRWTAAEADAEIEAIIEAHRRRDIGFTWMRMAHDTPADLDQRLEQHGLALAGTAAVMVRAGLDQLEDIPVNPEIRVTVPDLTDEAQLDIVIPIGAACFNWPDEALPRWRAEIAAMARNPKLSDQNVPFLAYLDGQPAGFARLTFSGGLAYLSGAGTLPAFRGRKVYSTLLRRRLEEAGRRGYHLATIQAEPMSRRIVVRYGFKEYGQTHLYAWMPVMDMDVIRALVPNE